MQADDGRLVAELDTTAHMAKGGLGIGRAVLRDGASGEIEIEDQTSTLTHGAHDLLIDEGLTDTGQGGSDLLHIMQG